MNFRLELDDLKDEAKERLLNYVNSKNITKKNNFFVMIDIFPGIPAKEILRKIVKNGDMYIYVCNSNDFCSSCPFEYFECYGINKYITDKTIEYLKSLPEEQLVKFSDLKPYLNHEF